MPKFVFLIKSELFQFIVVLAVGPGLSIKEYKCLLSECGQLVDHITSMVLFGSAVVDGFPEPCSKGVSIGAVNSEPFVVLVEIVNSYDSLELFLEVGLNFEIETAKVIIQVFAKLDHIFFVQGLHRLAKGEKD